MWRACAALFYAGALLASGCSAVAPDSGVQGTVTAGPFCPVERADQPCPDRPAQVHLQAIRFPPGFVGVPAPQSGRVVARFASGADGRFRVALPPGEYLLYGDPRATGFVAGCRASADVPPHRWLQINVGCDTGIR